MARIRWLAALLLLAPLAAPSLARGADAPSPVETRQAGQDLVDAIEDGMVAVVKAKGDLRAVERGARAIARWMRQFPDQFPPGSDKDSRATPAVWSDSAGFRRAADALVTEAQKLAEVAKGGDFEAVSAQIQAMDRACLACHRTFRARR